MERQVGLHDGRRAQPRGAAAVPLPGEGAPALLLLVPTERLRRARWLGRHHRAAARARRRDAVGGPSARRLLPRLAQPGDDARDVPAHQAAGPSHPLRAPPRGERAAGSHRLQRRAQLEPAVCGVGAPQVRPFHGGHRGVGRPAQAPAAARLRRPDPGALVQRVCRDGEPISSDRGADRLHSQRNRSATHASIRAPRLLLAGTTSG